MIRVAVSRLLIPVCDGCHTEGPGVFAGPEDEHEAGRAARRRALAYLGHVTFADVPGPDGKWLCGACRERAPHG